MDSGVLLLDKETGMSSAQALTAVKRRLGLKKIGHAGTLDPLATGLLVCLIGPATRLAQYAAGGRKVYSGVFEFGLRTDSDDISGKVLERSACRPSFSDIYAAAQRYIGQLQQVPPAVSAVKVNGRRAYQRARAGEDFELAARTVQVYRLELSPEQPGRAAFVVECSGGTYIRSLARDIGADLGCGGCLAALRREASLPFAAINSKQAGDLQLSDIMPWEGVFPDVPQVPVDPAEVKLLRVGNLQVLLDIAGRVTGCVEQPKWLICVEAGTQRAVALLNKSERGWAYAFNAV